ncbi:hypothetical protein EVAR_5862_1 [Eumeta japonica]|uniref:Uncharacterized protein n=1 Tax=Eumeta variegata TaxID=151549 RepID=A0A4C1TFE5_EUMVA|nr:hypothetical protein EVAR_5862_1 [Eumeta japonica]
MGKGVGDRQCTMSLCNHVFNVVNQRRAPAALSAALLVREARSACKSLQRKLIYGLYEIYSREWVNCSFNDFSLKFDTLFLLKRALCRLLVSMDGDDHLRPGNSHARLLLRNANKTCLCALTDAGERRVQVLLTDRCASATSTTIYESI